MPSTTCNNNVLVDVFATLSLNSCKSSSRRGWATFHRASLPKETKVFRKMPRFSIFEKKIWRSCKLSGPTCYQGKHARHDYFPLSQTVRSGRMLRVMDCDIIDTVFRSTPIFCNCTRTSLKIYNTQSLTDCPFANLSTFPSRIKRFEKSQFPFFSLTF